ncbi:UNVERIFIED_CONTAM: hypothetical protein FKN15_072721 [Acipenser sinensis]
MFAKLKKKIAEEAAIVPHSGAAGRIPRSVSKESITSVGADSGDDFVCINTCIASMRKLQEQNEAYQASRAKMSEGMELALKTKDQEKNALTLKLDEMMEQSLNLFQKRDELDELEGFQQQELAKVKHMVMNFIQLISKEDILMQREKALEKHVLDLKQTREELRQTSEKLASMEENKQCFETRNRELQTEREELLATRVEAEKKITELEKRGQELQTVVQQVSEDFQKAQSAAAMLEKTLRSLQSEHESLKLQQKQNKQKMANAVEEKDKQIAHLQVKVSSLEKRINSNLSEDEHLQELLKEISELEQRIQECNEKFKKSEEQINDKEAQIKKLYTDFEAENNKLQQHIAAGRHQNTERVNRLEAQISALETAREFDKTAAQHRISQLEQENNNLKEIRTETENTLKKQEAELERAKTELRSRETVSVEIAKALEETQKQKEELQQQVVKLTITLDDKDQSVIEKTEELTRREEDLKHLKQGKYIYIYYNTELRSRETVSVEIAKALEETQKQKEELQQQVVKLTITLDDKDQSVIEKTEELTRREEDLKHLKQEFEAAQSQLQQLQTEIESMRRTTAEKEGAAETQLSSQRQEVRTQTEQLETCQTQAKIPAPFPTRYPFVPHQDRGYRTGTIPYPVLKSPNRAVCPTCTHGSPGADSADWQQKDVLSIATTKKVDEQEWAFPLEDLESDSTFPEGKLSLVRGALQFCKCPGLHKVRQSSPSLRMSLPPLPCTLSAPGFLSEIVVLGSPSYNSGCFSVIGVHDMVVHLEAEVQALNERLNPPEDAGKEQNGAVTADDVSEIQRLNQELEHQVSEKNKTIKQLQQRLAELKKTLLKELKIKAEAEPPDVKERLGPEPPTIVSAATTVTNNSDLNDSREINFEYLKHVVLKFMSSREAEAYQLIKAVSMLLNFTQEEEDMLKQTLEYKMSWFGSKPSPKGIIRPSVSGAPTHWN